MTVSREIAKSDASSFENENLEDFTLVWLDHTFPGNTDRLREAIHCLKTFEKLNECLEYIRSMKDEKLFVIASGSQGEDLLPYIHPLRQVVSIFIFCLDVAAHKDWIKAYPHIRGLFTDEETLFASVVQDFKLRSRTPSNLSSILIGNDGVDKEYRRDYEIYLFYQSLSKIIGDPYIKYDATAKSEFLELCRSYYTDNRKMLESIDLFERDYTPTKAVSWYTRDTFVYRLVNRALRTQNLRIINKCRFFLSDLYTMMAHIRTVEDNVRRQKPSFTVYRGQQLMEEDLIKIQENRTLSFNVFLSTSTSPEIADIFASDDPNDAQMKCVKFEIEIIRKHLIHPYLDISRMSNMPDEGEILFALGTTFRVVSVKPLSKSTYYALLTSDEATYVQSCTTTALKCILAEKDTRSIVAFLADYSIFTLPRIEWMLKDLSSYLRYKCDYYLRLALFYKDSDQVEQERIQFDNAIETVLAEQPLLAGILMTSVAVVCHLQSDHSQALQFYSRAIEVMKDCPGWCKELLALSHIWVGTLSPDPTVKVNNYLEAIEVIVSYRTNLHQLLFSPDFAKNTTVQQSKVPRFISFYWYVSRTDLQNEAGYYRMTVMSATVDLVCVVLYHQLSRLYEQHLKDPKQASDYEVKALHILKRYAADNPQRLFVFAGAITRILRDPLCDDNRKESTATLPS